MAGHFALGNSNTLATIDVAGAFIVSLFFFSFCKPKNTDTFDQTLFLRESLVILQYFLES